MTPYYNHIVQRRINDGYEWDWCLTCYKRVKRDTHPLTKPMVLEDFMEETRL